MPVISVTWTCGSIRQCQNMCRGVPQGIQLNYSASAECRRCVHISNSMTTMGGLRSLFSMSRSLPSSHASRFYGRQKKTRRSLSPPGILFIVGSQCALSR